jgi:type IV secretion system protein VirD4
LQFRSLPRGLPGTNPETGQASRALWLDPRELRDPFWQYGTGKIFLGETEDGDPVGVADNRHLLTVAGSRAGKGISAIIPNLLLYEGSVLVLDPKGENATITAERRGHGRGIAAGGLGHEVYVIDPFGFADVDDAYRAGFNPLAELDPAAPEFIDDCDGIADALVVAEAGKENDFWNGSARIILRGFIAWVAADPNIYPQERHLKMVRRLLTLPKESFLRLLERMVEHSEVAEGIPQQAAGFLLSMESRERANVMSTVQQHIAFMASPPMAAMLEGKGRHPDLKGWKFGGKSIYLCLPAMRLHRQARFFRLFVNALLNAVEADRRVPAIPALMILDEMHALGRMAALETAAGLVAGYGLRIWSIWQDFSQLKSIYGERWETFLGNASIFQSFGLNDLATLRYVSERLGKSPTLSVSRSQISSEQEAQGFTGKSKSLQMDALLSPDEIAYFFSRQSGNQLVIYPGPDPIFMRRVSYLDDRFKPLRKPDATVRLR